MSQHFIMDWHSTAVIVEIQFQGYWSYKRVKIFLTSRPSKQREQLGFVYSLKTGVLDYTPRCGSRHTKVCFNTHKGVFQCTPRCINLAHLHLYKTHLGVLGGREEVNPGGSRFGHSIVYNRCLHGARIEDAQNGLKSSRPLDRADYLQTGTNPERDECEQRYISDRSQLRFLLRKSACSTMHCKNNNNGRQENI